MPEPENGRSAHPTPKLPRPSPGFDASLPWEQPTGSSSADLLRPAATESAEESHRPPTVYRVATGAQPRRIWRDPDGGYYGEVPLVAESADLHGRQRRDHPAAPTAPPPAASGGRSRATDPPPPEPSGGEASHPPGASAGRVRAVREPDGRVPRPDPAQVTTSAEFVAAMHQYRLWAGAPSYAEMSRNCGEVCSVTSFHSALTNNELPRLPLVNAFVLGCGGDEEEFRRWADTWYLLSARQRR